MCRSSSRPNVSGPKYTFQMPSSIASSPTSAPTQTIETWTHSQFQRMPPLTTVDCSPNRIRRLRRGFGQYVPEMAFCGALHPIRYRQMSNKGMHPTAAKGKEPV